jgi:predicted secreted hydrolase
MRGCLLCALLIWLPAVGCTDSSGPGPDAGAPDVALAADTALLDAAPAEAGGEAGVDAGPAIQLPADEAPHGDPDEWWYYTGVLDTGSGKPYGFELVVFQRMMAGVPMYLGHFGITDQQQGTFSFDAKMSLLPQPQPAAGFALKIEDWSMSGHAGADKLQAALPGYAIDLTLSATHPVVLQYGDGVMSVGGKPFYYYSYTDMAVTGTLTVNDVKQNVTGTAWMDHQWGDLGVMGQDFEGWDWYSLRLDDDSEWMLFVVRHVGKPSVAGGTLVDPSGAATNLAPGSFTVTASDSWTSPHTGAVYPQGWTVKVPSGGLDVTLTPVLEDQELYKGHSNAHKYWEGLCTVGGTRQAKPVGGYAYVELVGYVP